MPACCHCSPSVFHRHCFPLCCVVTVLRWFFVALVPGCVGPALCCLACRRQGCQTPEAVRGDTQGMTQHVVVGSKRAGAIRVGQRACCCKWPGGGRPPDGRSPGRGTVVLHTLSGPDWRAEPRHSLLTAAKLAETVCPTLPNERRKAGFFTPRHPGPAPCCTAANEGGNKALAQDVGGDGLACTISGVKFCMQAEFAVN